MAKVTIKAHINLKQDHCKYGEDLNDFLTKIQELVSVKEDLSKINDICNKNKLHHKLRFLNIITQTTYTESWYIIEVDGVERNPVIGNQIWMHELPTELVNLLG